MYALLEANCRFVFDHFSQIRVFLMYSATILTFRKANADGTPGEVTPI